MISRAVAMLEAVVVTGSLLACVGTPVKLSVQENVSYDESAGGEISGRACGAMFLGFIPARVNDRQRRAYDLLVSQAAGEHIADIRVMESWDYGFILTRYCTTLSATAYPLRSVESPSEPSGASPF